VSSRSLASFTCFVPLSAAPLPRDGSLLRTSYDVEAVVPVRGAAVPGIEPGQAWSRLEQPGALPLPAAPFIGTTQHVVYTDAATRAELSQISRASAGPLAVLIPICKSASWWALAQDERQSHFTPGRRPGHTALGRPFAARIYRRLYHARHLPGSAWDFLTYFELPESERGAFQELLSILRDPESNPEWAFVDRELEIWMRKRSD
jgi:hypothetical protein